MSIPHTAPRELWAHIARAARQTAGFDPRALSMVSAGARNGVRNTATFTTYPRRLVAIYEFGRVNLQTVTARARRGLSEEGARHYLLSHNRDMRAAALELLTEDGTFNVQLWHEMEIFDPHASPHPDEWLAWCEKTFDDLVDPWEAQEWFNSQERCLAFYEPTARAWLDAVCADVNLDLQEAWDTARRDYLVSVGLQPLTP